MDLTAVGNARAAEVEFSKLSAAQQTSPHDCVSHLGAGQPQHLQTRWTIGLCSLLKSDPESAFNCHSLTNLQVRQARDEGSHAPTGYSRSVQAEILQLLKALQR